jgi:hypothetical protein
MTFSSECLIENNVIYNLNKPVQARVSGGGNVCGYNYIDDAWTGVDPGSQETGIDFGHSSFPHHDLYEGNWVPQIGADNVWGNSGWCTAFRNWATGIQKRTPKMEPKSRCNMVAAIGLQSRAINHNFVGNVLGLPGQGQIYEVHGAPPGTGNNWAIWRIGWGVGQGGGTFDSQAYDPYPWQPGSAGATVLRHGNFDYATNSVIWEPSVADRVLPASLYLAGKPAFFGSLDWPWVDPVGPKKTLDLPAKRRFDAGAP